MFVTCTICANSLGGKYSAGRCSALIRDKPSAGCSSTDLYPCTLDFIASIDVCHLHDLRELIGGEVFSGAMFSLDSRQAQCGVLVYPTIALTEMEETAHSLLLLL